MHILFCTNSIGTRGGIERVTIVKANALAEMRNPDGELMNRVGIAYSDRFRFPETVHPLSPLVLTFDTEADIWHDWNYKGIEKYTEPRRKMRKYHEELQRIVNEFRPDVIIGVGQSEKFILPKLKTSWPMVRIREVHFNSTHRKYSFGQSGRLGRLKWAMADFIDYKINCHKYDKAYLLTLQDKDENFAKDDHFSWMWNPSSFEVNESANLKSLRTHEVIASGRLNFQKDFPALLRAWALLADRRGDWKLKIIGEGGDLGKLQKLADELGIMDCVELPGYSSDVAGEMRRASIFAMTSLFEGFGLVIVEAMSCRLPVVSFDTKYGPRDIIRDGVDGFLVENRDEKVFTERLYQLMTDVELREKMAANAEQRAKDFDVHVIAKKWMAEYQSLLSAKQEKCK